VHQTSSDRSVESNSHLYVTPRLRIHGPIPVAVRSKGWVCGRSLAGIAGSNPAGARMSGSCECCVLSGRGPCVELIPRPRESYRVWCVSECDREAWIMRRPWPTGGCWAVEKKTEYLELYLHSFIRGLLNLLKPSGNFT
jgi:hypothetical protein